MSLITKTTLLFAHLPVPRNLEFQGARHLWVPSGPADDTFIVNRSSAIYLHSGIICPLFRGNLSGFRSRRRTSSPSPRPQAKAAAGKVPSSLERHDSFKRSGGTYRAGTKPSRAHLGRYHSPTSSKAMHPCQSCTVALVLVASLVNAAPLTERPSGVNDVTSTHSGDFISGEDVWRTSLSSGPTFTELASSEAIQTPLDTMNSKR